MTKSVGEILKEATSKLNAAMEVKMR